MVPTRRWMVTGKESGVLWHPTRCSLACAKRWIPTIPSSQRWCERSQRWQGLRWQRPKASQRQRNKEKNPCNHFGKATNKSAAAVEAMRKHHKKLEAARKNLEELQSSSPKWSLATRPSMPPARGVDLDETDAQVREAEAALARATEESASKRRKTNTNECDA